MVKCKKYRIKSLYDNKLIRPHRLGIVSKMYPELTTSFITESLKNVYYNEGKASKGFSEYEERQLFDSFKNIFNQFHGGIFSSKQFREFAHMSNSPSDRVLASNVLNKWLKAGKLEKLKRGNFQFIEKTTVEVEKDILKTLIDVFKEAQNFAKSNQ